MRKILFAALALILVFSHAAAVQNPNSAPTDIANDNTTRTKKRGPIFRANKEQIKQTQTILKQRGFYGGEATGKLDADTRAGLKKFQEAEGIKATGTLNRATLEKLGVALTDKQRAMPQAT